MSKFFKGLILAFLLTFSPIIVCIAWGQSGNAGVEAVLIMSVIWTVYLTWMIASWAIWHFAPLIHARNKMYRSLREQYEADKAAGNLGRYGR